MHTRQKREYLFRFRILRIFSFILFLLTVCGPPVFAKVGPDTKTPAPAGIHSTVLSTPQAWPQSESDLKPDPAVIYGQLPNGFRYVLMPNKKPENRVSMHLNVAAGSIDEAENQRGLAHFLEHMMFCGSTHFKPGELIKYFQRIGMKFGPDANARTGFFNTRYDLDLPTGNRKSLSEGMLVLSDFAAGATILPSEVDRERSVILAEKRARDSVSYRTFVSTLRFELPDTRFSRRLPIGRKGVIKAANRSRLKSFYDTWYRPEKMTLVMVGDFNSETAIRLIKKNFSGITPRAAAKPDPDPGRFVHHGILPFYHHEADAGSTNVSIEVVTRHPAPPDTIAYETKQLLQNMADRIVQYRLDKMQDQPDTPFTQAQIDSGNYYRFVDAAEITADCAPQNWDKSLSAIEKTLRRALTHGFTESEVKRVQKEFIAAFDRAVNAAPTRDSGALAHRIIGDLTNGRVFQSPKQQKELFEPVVRAATPATLLSAFKEVWSPDHRLVMVTGNADLHNGEESPTARILSVFKKSRAEAITKPSEKEAAAFPYLSEPKTPGKIKSRKEIKDLGILCVTFENGVRLNIRKTDYRADQVLAALTFGTGRSGEPADRPGLAILAEKVVNLSGLGKMDRDALNQALAGKNTSVSFDAEEDRFTFSAVSVKEEIPLMFQLFYAHLIDPGFRQSAYIQARKQLRQDYETLIHSIEGGVSLYGQRFLADGDSRFGLPALSTMEAIPLSAVRSFIDKSLKSAPLEIDVVGDVDVNTVIRCATTYFGSLPERSGKIKPTVTRRVNFPKGRSLVVKIPTPIDKGMVIAAYPTTDIWNIHTTRCLSILSEIFSDQMMQRIREKLGAAYSPFSYNRPSRAYPGYGVLQALVIVNPKDAETVRDAISSIAADLAKNGVTKDELKRAQKPILTGIREQIKTNGYWLNTVLKGSGRHPAQLEWSRTILADYQTINAGEIDRVARDYLTPSAAADIFVYPVKDARSPSAEIHETAQPAGTGTHGK